MLKHLFMTSLAAFLLMSSQSQAQTAPASTPPPQKPAAVPVAGAEPAFTQAELETMVAPVALYPDTLLMQILVASTEPLDVMKADQYLLSNDADAATRQQYVQSQTWDESVKVLTSAFPDVIKDMADHIDWTESMGNAMLTQSDDVMTAIQTMRLLAVDNGALTSGSEQKVEVQPPPVDSTDSADRTVVITPTDPQRIYVPQYNPSTVYFSSLGNIVAATAVAFGTAVLIDDIFDDDDDWNRYWGCHDCGGWNGQPIIRNPNINLDVDGNVRIGNRVDIDRENLAWKPDRNKIESARARIHSERLSADGQLAAINKNASVQDELRKRIPDRLDQRPDINRPSHFSAADKANAIQRTKATHHAGANRAAVSAKKPVAHRAQHPQKPVVHQAGHKKPTAFKRQASCSHTRMASQRGHTSRGHQMHRR